MDARNKLPANTQGHALRWDAALLYIENPWLDQGFSIYNKLAESCQKNLIKGRMVLIKGSLVNDNYKDDQGTKHRKTITKAVTVEFLDSRKNSLSQSAASQVATNQAVNTPYITSDKLSLSEVITLFSLICLLNAMTAFQAAFSILGTQLYQKTKTTTSETILEGRCFL